MKQVRRTAILVGVLALSGLFYSPNANASTSTTEVQQATKKITGTVVDAMGPVIGASVVEKGTTNATVTDFDGNFTLNVKPGAAQPPGRGPYPYRYPRFRPLPRGARSRIN